MKAVNTSRLTTLAATLILLLFGAPGHAVIETYEFSSEALEKRYRALSQELRCPKCQNQNIADSNALVSKDLRQLLYQQLEAGASDEQILEAMVDRYGEFVRYRPSATGATLWLWILPALLLLLAVVATILLLRGRQSVSDTPISDAERQRLAELLEAEAPGK